MTKLQKSQLKETKSQEPSKYKLDLNLLKSVACGGEKLDQKPGEYYVVFVLSTRQDTNEM